MTSSTNNLAVVARDICSKRLSRHGGYGAELATNVDRYWHCVAAELEAGLIDDTGNLMPEPDFDKGLVAYRDWCLRHPESRRIVNGRN